MRTERRLVAILAADLVGYSRMMAVDEASTLTALRTVRKEVFDPAIAEHGGRIVKTTGDGLLVEFPSAVDAMGCAMSVQSAMVASEAGLRFRIGVNVGDVVIEDGDILGDGPFGGAPADPGEGYCRGDLRIRGYQSGRPLPTFRTSNRRRLVCSILPR